MSEVVVISGDGGQVQIEVLDYERPRSTESDDANWLVCRCDVKVREFSCAVNLSATTEDFVRFLRDLEEAVHSLRGKAVFTTPEATLKLEIEFHSAGHADVVGTVQSRFVVPSQTTLDFSFESDQSFLSASVDGLRAVVKQFPIKQGS